MRVEVVTEDYRVIGDYNADLDMPTSNNLALALHHVVAGIYRVPWGSDWSYQMSALLTTCIDNIRRQDQDCNYQY